MEQLTDHGATAPPDMAAKTIEACRVAYDSAVKLARGGNWTTAVTYWWAIGTFQAVTAHQALRLDPAFNNVVVSIDPDGREVWSEGYEDYRVAIKGKKNDGEMQA